MTYAFTKFSGFDFVLLHIVMQETEIMNQGKTVLAQIMSLIPRYEFGKCVKRYNGNRHTIEFKCRDQFLVMSFAQFIKQISLRSIEATLLAFAKKLYNINQDLYILSSAIGSVLFERKPLGELFIKPKRPLDCSDSGQLTLWENFFGQ